jgi:hypothetical protein
MRPRNAYKDILDNVVSLITCVSMNHQNQLKQIANGATFATRSMNRKANLADTHLTDERKMKSQIDKLYIA